MMRRPPRSTLFLYTTLEKTTPLASGPCRWPRWSSPRRPASSTGTRWTPVSPCPGSPPAGTARDLLLPAPVGESRRSGRVPRCCFAEPAILPSPRRPPFASSASRSRLLPASVPETTRSRCTRGRSPGSSPDEPQRARHLDFAGLAFRHHGERRQVAIVVQQQVQLDGALRLLVLRPVEHAHRQVDDAAVQTHQLVLETELLSPALAAHQFLALEQRLFEHRLVQLPRSMLIGVGQRGSLGRHRHPQMLQLSLATRQTAANLAQRMRASQLAKQHGHELAPTGETPRVPLGFVLLDGLLEVPTREQLQHLRENAAYFVHRLSLL